MPGPEFFETPMGRRFYEATMPSIARSLERLANQPLETDGKLDALKASKPIVQWVHDLIEGKLSAVGVEVEPSFREAVANAQRLVQKILP